MQTLLLLTLAMGTGMAFTGIEGKWRSERAVGDADGKTYPHVTVITLKAIEGGLTGSLVATSEAPWMRETTGKSFEIQNGAIDGDKVSFRIVYEGKSGTRTAIYEATVSGDEMKGTVKFRGTGQTWDFDAKRIP